MTTANRVTSVPVAVRPRTIEHRGAGARSRAAPRPRAPLRRARAARASRWHPQSPRFALDAPALLARARACAATSDSTTRVPCSHASCSTGSSSWRPASQPRERGDRMDPHQADPENPGGAARRADQGAALRAHRGRRRASAARAARPARWPRRPLLEARRRRRGRAAHRCRAAARAAAARVRPGRRRPSRSISRALGQVLDAADARSPSGSRTSTSPSSTCCSRWPHGRTRALPAGCWREQGVTRGALPGGADARCAAASASPAPPRRPPTRRSRSTAATSSPRRARAGSTR